jgi:hypothetical protein
MLDAQILKRPGDTASAYRYPISRTISSPLNLCSPTEDFLGLVRALLAPGEKRVQLSPYTARVTTTRVPREIFVRYFPRRLDVAGVRRPIDPDGLGARFEVAVLHSTRAVFFRCAYYVNRKGKQKC